MNELSWAQGLIAWIVGGMIVVYLWGLFVDAGRRQYEWRKRQELKRLRQIQRGRAAQGGE